MRPSLYEWGQLAMWLQSSDRWDGTTATARSFGGQLFQTGDGVGIAKPKYSPNQGTNLLSKVLDARNQSLDCPGRVGR